MTPKQIKDTKKSKLVNFLLDEDIRGKVDEFCEKQQLSLSQFLRNAIFNYLENPIPQTSKEITTISTLDPKNFELVFQRLSDLELKLEKSMDYLIERQQKQVAVADDKVKSAKDILLEKKPDDYDKAFLHVEDVDTLTEAINQLLIEKKVKYERRKFTWLE